MGRKTFTDKKPAATSHQAGKVVPAVSEAARAENNRHEAEQFLRGKIGGRWRYNPEAKRFEAEFEGKLATFIAGYLQSQAGITCTSADALRDETLLGIAAADFAAVFNCRPLRGEPKTLKDQYASMQAMGRISISRG